MNLEQHSNYFRGAYRYHCAASCLAQISKHIILESANNVLNIK